MKGVVAVQFRYPVELQPGVLQVVGPSDPRLDVLKWKLLRIPAGGNLACHSLKQNTFSPEAWQLVQGLLF